MLNADVYLVWYDEFGRYMELCGLDLHLSDPSWISYVHDGCCCNIHIYEILPENTHNKFGVTCQGNPLNNPLLPAVGMELSLIYEQCINIKLLAKLGTNGGQIFECFKQVHGHNSLKEPTVNKCSREGQEEVTLAIGIDRPSASSSEQNVERIPVCVLKQRLMTVIMIVDVCQSPKQSFTKFWLEKLKMKKLSAKIVTKLLTPEQHAWNSVLTRKFLDFGNIEIDFFLL